MRSARSWRAASARVRFGSDDDGLQLGRARFALTQPIGELWSAHLDASMFDDRDRSPLGVTEAYLLFRPYPFAGYRFRTQGRRFYPPHLAREPRLPAGSRRTRFPTRPSTAGSQSKCAPSGVEGQLDWLGTRSGHDFDLGVTGGVFGWNEGAGAVLASDGFSLTDRQTPLFGRVGQPGVAPLNGAEPFLQFDHRAGVYGGLEARYLDRRGACGCCATTTAPTPRRSTTSPAQSPGRRASPAPACASRASTAGRRSRSGSTARPPSPRRTWR